MISLIYIQGMNDEEQAKDVAIKLRELDGVATVYVSYSESHVRIEYNENKLSLEKISNTINSMGLTAGEHNEDK